MELTDESISMMLGEVSKNISRERKKRGMSMARLAESANLSVSHIFKVENAQCEIGLKALLKISTAFGMEVTDFLPYEKQEEKSEEVMTSGEKFENIMEGADPRSVEFVLHMSAYMVKAFEDNISYRKRKR